jgi:hypothetical protein
MENMIRTMGDKWLITKNVFLGNKTPAELIARGQACLVREFLEKLWAARLNEGLEMKRRRSKEAVVATALALVLLVFGSKLAAVMLG